MQASEGPTLLSDEDRSQNLLRGSSHTNRRSQFAPLASHAGTAATRTRPSIITKGGLVSRSQVGGKGGFLLSVGTVA